MQFVLILVGVAALALAYRFWSKRRTRLRLLSTGLSPRDRTIVADQVPLTRRLPAALQAKLEGKINLFLEQIDFVGCNGLEVTDEMRLSIAAQACLLVVNSDAWYENLATVLIYPDAFRSREMVSDGYVVSEEEVVRIGESWRLGPVVLSWRHSEKGADDPGDGRNVVLHEFAHQLDDLSGDTDAAPILDESQTFAEWESAIVDAYDRHLNNVETGRASVLDEYGAHSHEEFFAVAVEVFFERPNDLKEAEPAVYEQLKILLRLDPATWAPR